MHTSALASNPGSPVFSPRIIQGMTGGRGLGMACGHIKAFGLFPSPHQTKICAEGLQGQHASSMLERTLLSFVGGKRVWYTLSAHVPNFPEILGILIIP